MYRILPPCTTLTLIVEVVIVVFVTIVVVVVIDHGLLVEFIVAQIQKNLQSTIYHIIDFDLMCITAVILHSGSAILVAISIDTITA